MSCFATLIHSRQAVSSRCMQLDYLIRREIRRLSGPTHRSYRVARPSASADPSCRCQSSWKHPLPPANLTGLEDTVHSTSGPRRSLQVSEKIAVAIFRVVHTGAPRNTMAWLWGLTRKRGELTGELPSRLVGAMLDKTLFTNGSATYQRLCSKAKPQNSGVRTAPLA